MVNNNNNNNKPKKKTKDKTYTLTLDMTQMRKIDYEVLKDIVPDIYKEIKEDLEASEEPPEFQVPVVETVEVEETDVDLGGS